MKTAIFILITLLVLLMVVCVSVCMAFTVRDEELSRNITDLGVRVDCLAEGLKLINKHLGEIDREKEKVIVRESSKGNIVSQEQVDEARKRAKL